MDSSVKLYIKKRVIQIPFLLLGITFLAFLLFSMSPTDPVVSYLGGPTVVQLMGPEKVEEVRQQLGLDQPFYIRYGIWLSHIIQGDFGYSRSQNLPVLDAILQRLPASLILVFFAYTLAVSMSIVLALSAAKREGSFYDHAMGAGAYLLYSTPSFLIALLMIYIFTVWLGVLPPARMVSLNPPYSFLGQIKDFIAHLIMPVITLAIAQFTVYYVYLRSALSEAMQQMYITLARAKGLSERSVLYRHALRNSLLPLITQIGLSMPAIIGGGVVVETLFAWPGVGNLTTLAAAGGDHQLMMGILLISSFLVIIGNLGADILYAVADPRVTYEEV